MMLAARVIGLICTLHVLGLLGFVGWLAGTGRLDAERLSAIRDLIREPAAEPAGSPQEVERIAQDAAEHAERLERDASLATAGPQSIAQQLETDRQRDEMTLRQIERARQEVEQMHNGLLLAQQRLEESRLQLDEQRRAFRQRLDRVERQYNEEGFRKTVQLLESLPADQTKQMFIAMLQGGRIDQIVAYLDAMQPRKSARVLESFETQEEIGYALELTERLRQRGSGLVNAAEPALDSPRAARPGGRAGGEPPATTSGGGDREQAPGQSFRGQAP